MKKYYYLMFAAILCCGMGLLTSCSSDDDNPTSEELFEKEIGILEHLLSAAIYQISIDGDVDDGTEGAQHDANIGNAQFVFLHEIGPETTHNLEVPGSSPGWSTSENQALAKFS